MESSFLGTTHQCQEVFFLQGVKAWKWGFRLGNPIWRNGHGSKCQVVLPRPTKKLIDLQQKNNGWALNMAPTHFRQKGKFSLFKERRWCFNFDNMTISSSWVCLCWFYDVSCLLPKGVTQQFYVWNEQIDSIHQMTMNIQHCSVLLFPAKLTEGVWIN